jgi:hypothetical protein
VTNGFGLLVATPSTKGTLPIEASGNGHIDLSEVPDFLAIALQNNRIVGYAPKKYLFPEGKNWMLQRPAESVPATVSLYSSFTTGNDWTPAKSAPASVPVYSSDLKTLVGVFYPGAWSVVTVIASASMPSTPPRTVADGQSKETSGSGSATVTWSDGPGRFAPKGVSELMALDAEIVLGLVSHDCRRFVR